MNQTGLENRIEVKPLSRKNFAAIVSGLALALVLNSAARAQTRQTGVLGLYALATSEPGIVDAVKIVELGCNLRLDGRIGGVQGKIDLQKPNRFVLLACEGTILGAPDMRAILDDLVPASTPLAVLEGDITDFSDAKPASAVEGRQYILKISYYNNEDVDARDRELAVLTRQSEQMTDRYFTETFIGVNLAEGMRTPDEVVVLFYDDS